MTENTTTNRREFLRHTGLITAGSAALAVGLSRANEAQAAQLLGRPSVDQQKQLGRQAAQQTLQQYPEVHDRRASHFAEIGRRLVAGLPREDQGKWDYSFHVLDSKQVNAFALPGGPMFMFTGLYQLLDSDDALAAVTGHEMTHVRREHWAKAYGKERERSLALGIGLSIFKAGRTASAVASGISSLVGLKYSRGEEDEADAGGLDNLVGAGYNPSGMLKLFYTLEKVSGSGGGPGGALLSNHPLTSQRIDHTKQRILTMDRSRRFPAVTPLDYRSLLG